MLTLTRKVGEKIIVTLEDGTTVEIVVREIRKNQARIGIKAPPTIKIFREEIFDNKEAQNIEKE